MGIILPNSYVVCIFLYCLSLPHIYRIYVILHRQTTTHEPFNPMKIWRISWRIFLISWRIVLISAVNIMTVSWHSIFLRWLGASLDTHENPFIKILLMKLQLLAFPWWHLGRGHIIGNTAVTHGRVTEQYQWSERGVGICWISAELRVYNKELLVPPTLLMSVRGQVISDL